LAAVGWLAASIGSFISGGVERPNVPDSQSQYWLTKNSSPTTTAPAAEKHAAGRHNLDDANFGLNERPGHHVACWRNSDLLRCQLADCY
jgi:hypothetical protein